MLGSFISILQISGVCGLMNILKTHYNSHVKVASSWMFLGIYIEGYVNTDTSTETLLKSWSENPPEPPPPARWCMQIITKSSTCCALPLR
jgi:hypothetical protein